MPLWIRSSMQVSSHFVANELAAYHDVQDHFFVQTLSGKCYKGTLLPPAIQLVVPVSLVAADLAVQPCSYSNDNCCAVDILEV